jgi:NAD(P)-dependent dehydrogenase (short-subunit alcohol dehydrogenase family)
MDALRGKVAIVTGAASGIGRAMVERFVAEGAKVVAGDVADDAGDSLAAELGDAVVYAHADVTQEGDVKGLVDTAVARFGRLDVMVNNAGTGGDPSGLLDLDVAGFDATLRLLLTSVAMGHKHAARRMRDQGGGGSIISTASIAGLEAGWGAVGYTSAKAAVINLVRFAAAELGPLGIRSNAICPGIIITPIFGAALPREHLPAFMEALPARMGPMQPLGRAGTPEDIANTALWLAGEGSSFVTGQAIVADGGATAVTARDLFGAIERAAADALG